MNTGNKNKKLSTFHLTLLSTGGMIGAGWLFSPFYGFQTAGTGVIFSWLITIAITLVIALSFAEVSSLLPIVGGVSRFVSLTHNRTITFIFMGLTWISYVVYLPLEAQSAIQYIGFFYPPVVVTNGDTVQLSMLGLACAMFIIIGLTYFNCFVITKVAKTNSFVSIWKLIIPITIAIRFILYFGKWDNVVSNYNNTPLSLEHILIAVTSSGLAFAFSGFQNGIILANSTSNPKKALPYSLFMPIILGGLIYISLSLAFIFCVPNAHSIANNAVAPLLGLVALSGLHTVYLILFVDAIIAPLGTANVFTAITGRVLLAFGREFLPNSILTRINKHSAPVVALWISGIVGICFLLPFPTWKQLVDFLSSVTVFAYLAGPITLITLHKDFSHLERNFKTVATKTLGYLGFICCSLLIYWSEYTNLKLLSILLIILIIFYAFSNKNKSILKVIADSGVVVVYVILLTLISYLRTLNKIPFPFDNFCVAIVAIIFCYLLVKSKLSNSEIEKNLATLHLEIKQEQEIE
jgi:amino acid transporter